MLMPCPKAAFESCCLQGLSQQHGALCQLLLGFWGTCRYRWRGPCASQHRVACGHELRPVSRGRNSSPRDQPTSRCSAGTAPFKLAPQTDPLRGPPRFCVWCSGDPSGCKPSGPAVRQPNPAVSRARAWGLQLLHTLMTQWPEQQLGAHPNQRSQCDRTGRNLWPCLRTELQALHYQLQQRLQGQPGADILQPP